MMPKVSVVVPAYNAMPFLPQAVESVLAQTFQAFELIIVNDGSTDETQAWLSRINDPRVKVCTQENRGLPAARNTGIEAASGDYIAFLDADDLWEKTKLEKQAASLDGKPHVGLVYSYITKIDTSGKPTSDTLRTRGTGDVYKYIVQENIVQCGSTPMVRRSCFDTVGVFDPELKAAEDWDMWIRIAAKFHFDLVPEPLTLYRMHQTNMSKSYQTMLPYSHKVIEKTFAVAAKQHSYLKNYAYGRTYLYSAQRAFTARDYRVSSNFLWQALKHYPKLGLSKNGIKLRWSLLQEQWLKGERL